MHLSVAVCQKWAKISYLKGGCHRPLMFHTPGYPTNIVDFRGFDSSAILIWRGGIPRSIGDFLESLSQAMLVGVMLVGRLGVPCLKPRLPPGSVPSGGAWKSYGMWQPAPWSSSYLRAYAVIYCHAQYLWLIYVVKLLFSLSLSLYIHVYIISVCIG